MARTRLEVVCSVRCLDPERVQLHADHVCMMSVRAATPAIYHGRSARTLPVTVPAVLTVAPRRLTLPAGGVSCSVGLVYKIIFIIIIEW